MGLATVATTRRPSRLADTDVYCSRPEVTRRVTLRLDIERPQPRPRPVLRARDVEQRARVERRQEIHRGVLRGQLLRRSARGSNAPHVHLVGRLRSVHEVDPLAVW